MRLNNHTYTDEQVCEWWFSTKELLHKFVDPPFPLVWLVDANLTLGSTTSQSVGNRHPKQQVPHGHLVHDDLLRLD